jgi:hypothetical protein
MELPIEVIVFWVLLLDSLVAVAIAWFGQKWYMNHFRVISRFLPMKRAWATYYLALVLWMGFMLCRSGMLAF